jgi:hypothetical protein
MQLRKSKWEQHSVVIRLLTKEGSQALLLFDNPDIKTHYNANRTRKIEGILPSIPYYR